MQARYPNPVNKSLPRLAIRLLILSLLCVSARTTGATEIEINGVDGRLAENVRVLIGNPPPVDNAKRFEGFVNAVESQAVEALSALGYYDPAVAVQLTEGSPDNPTLISIDINPGNPVRIRNLLVEVKGAAETDRQFQLAMQSNSLREGGIFVSSEYESVKSSLINAAQGLGYFDFRFDTTEVRVSRKRQTADVKIIARSGERFLFGPVRFNQSILTQTVLRRWLTFAPGDPYQSGLIGELTQNLQSSGYFASVKVKPIIDSRYVQVVPVSVELTPKKSNEVAIGVGYVDDSKLRGRLSWEKPLINSRGHSADFSLALSRDTKSAGFSYRVPRNEKPLYNFWGLEYGLKREDAADTESFLTTANLRHVTRTPRLWDRSPFLRWERETFTSSGIEDQTDLLLLGMSMARSRSSGSPFPERGQNLVFELTSAARKFFSSINILKAVAKFRYLRAISTRNTLIASLQYGAIKSDDYDRVPVSQRFFAGGDRSLRGFAYRSVSPTNAEGENVGGRFLEILNLEYNYRFRERWTAAVFSDAGRAFNSRATAHRIGAGVGIRWQSPVGPFRLDLARPVSGTDDSSFRVHISLGPEF
ncbi:MAG: autotransporter assembly complex family protein [Granulosicoccus sp.]